MAEPKYRFKRNDGGSYPAWKEMPLGTLVSDNLDPVPTPREGYRRVGIYCHAKGTFQEDVPAENVLDVDTMYRIHKDNLIVNITFAWEHAVAIVKPEDEGLLVSHRFPEYSFNAGQVPGFYKYLVLRPYFRNQLSLASPGGAGRNRVLNKAQFKKILVSVPCEEEQQKIADFLSSVDEVITASEEEVANLETQKKAVMKKIFSQEVRVKRADGSDFPEWEEKKLGDICEFIRNGFTYDADGLRTHRNRITRIETISSGFIDEEKCGCTDVDVPAKYLLRDGDILFSHINSLANLGKTAMFEERFGKVYHGMNLLCIRPRFECLLPYYLLSLLRSPISRTWVLVHAKRAVNQCSIPSSDLDGMLVSVPSLEEQRLIANFLSDFDEAIAAAKKELELWKELKKGLLQQMFV